MKRQRNWAVLSCALPVRIASALFLFRAKLGDMEARDSPLPEWELRSESVRSSRGHFRRVTIGLFAPRECFGGKGIHVIASYILRAINSSQANDHGLFNHALPN